MKALANSLAGTGALARLILRRDRVVLPLWVAVLALLPVSIANTLKDLYPTAAERQAYLDIVTANPALGALYGRAFGSDLGALTAWRLGGTVLLIGLASGDVGRDLPRVLAAAIIHLPAVWVLVGVTVAIFGVLPRFMAFGGWTVLAACVLIEEFGRPLQLSKRVLNLSPFAHVPNLPGGDVSATPLVWLTLVAVALIAVGLLSFRRRDVL